jgi:hypothetical protein
MPYRAGKPTGRLIPRRLIFRVGDYNDLRGIGLPAGLIWGLNLMALSLTGASYATYVSM